MPITVRVRNFQSIEDATIVIDGFTVISGPNNSGKTSLMRAIRGVFTNAPPGPLVRHGTAHLTVDIDFGDGNTVSWKKGWQKPDQKGGTINEYTVNGKKLGAKVGRGCPDEVSALGVRFIDAGTDRLWPQIADQFGGVLFLVNTPGSTVAEAVADVDRVGKLSTALKLSEKDRRAVLSTLKIRRKDIESVADKIEEFKGFDDVVISVTGLERSLKEAKSQETEFEFFHGLFERHEGARRKVEDLDGVDAIPMPDSSKVKEGRQHSTHLRDLTSLSTRHSQVASTVSHLDGVDEIRVPVLKSAVDKKQELLDLLVLQGNHKVASENVQRLEGVAGAAVPPQEAVVGGRKVQGALSFFMSLQGRISGLQDEIKRLEREIEEADVEHKDAQSEVGVLITELGVCPTCRRPASVPHDHDEVTT